jgi:hypothetical protein
MNFFIQNVGWSALNPRKALAVKRAMDAYRKAHPICEITGSDKGVQIHHIVPVWANPDLADDPTNFIALSTSSNIHNIFGHDGDFGHKYVSNVKEIANKVLAIKTESAIIVRRKSEVEVKTCMTLKSFLKKVFDFRRKTW